MVNKINSDSDVEDDTQKDYLIVSRSKLSLTDRYRLQLSAADLLFVLVLPFWAADAAVTDWRFGLGTCEAMHVIYTVNLYRSVLILAFISLNRYLAVVKATDTHASRTRQQIGRASCRERG